jgi:hypothetical protein
VEEREREKKCCVVDRRSWMRSVSWNEVKIGGDEVVVGKDEDQGRCSRKG